MRAPLWHLVVPSIFAGVAADSPFNPVHPFLLWKTPWRKDVSFWRSAETLALTPGCEGIVWGACANNQQERLCGGVAQKRWCSGSVGADDYCGSTTCQSYQGACSKDTECVAEHACWQPISRRGHSVTGDKQLYAQKEWETKYPTATWADAVRDPDAVFTMPLCVPKQLFVRAAYSSASNIMDNVCQNSFSSALVSPNCVTDVPAPKVADKNTPCPLLEPSTGVTGSEYNVAQLSADINTALSGGANQLPGAAALTSHWTVSSCVFDVAKTNTGEAGLCTASAPDETFTIDLAAQINAKIANGQPQVPAGFLKVSGRISAKMRPQLHLDQKAAKTTLRITDLEMRVDGKVIVDSSKLNGASATWDQIKAHIPGMYAATGATSVPILRAIKGGQMLVPITAYATVTPVIHVDTFKLQAVPKSLLTATSKVHIVQEFGHRFFQEHTVLKAEIDMVNIPHHKITAGEFGVESEAPTVTTSVKEGNTDPASQAAVTSTDTGYDIRVTVGTKIDFSANGFGLGTVGPLGAQQYLRGKFDNNGQTWRTSYVAGAAAPPTYAGSAKSVSEDMDVLGMGKELCVQTGLQANVTCCHAALRFMHRAATRFGAHPVNAVIQYERPAVPSYASAVNMFGAESVDPEKEDPAKFGKHYSGGTTVYMSHASAGNARVAGSNLPLFTSVDGETDARMCERYDTPLQTAPNANCSGESGESWVSVVHKYLKCPIKMGRVHQWDPEWVSSADKVQCYVCGLHVNGNVRRKVGNCPGLSRFEKKIGAQGGVQRCCYDEKSILISPSPDITDYYEFLNIPVDTANNQMAAKLNAFSAQQKKNPEYQRAAAILGNADNRALYDGRRTVKIAKALNAGSPWRHHPRAKRPIPAERLELCHCGKKKWQEMRAPFQPEKPRKVKNMVAAGRHASPLSDPAPAKPIQGSPAASTFQMKTTPDGGKCQACLHPGLARMMAGGEPPPVQANTGPETLTEEEAAEAAKEKQRQAQVNQNKATGKTLPVEGIDDWQCRPLRLRLANTTGAVVQEMMDRLSLWSAKTNVQLDFSVAPEAKRMARPLQRKLKEFLRRVGSSCRNIDLSVKVLKGWTEKDIHTDGSLYYGGRALTLKFDVVGTPAQKKKDACANAIRGDAIDSFRYAKLPVRILQKCSRKRCTDITAFSRKTEETKYGYYRSLNAPGVFEKEVEKRSKHIFVMFYATWDPAAAQVRPAWHRLSDHVLKDANIRSLLTVASVDVVRHPGLIAKYNLKKSPTVIWFDKSKTSERLPESQSMADTDLFAYVNKKLGFTPPASAANRHRARVLSSNAPYLDALADPPIPKYPTQKFPFEMFVCELEGPRGASQDPEVNKSPPPCPLQGAKAQTAGRRADALNAASPPPFAAADLPASATLAALDQPIEFTRVSDGADGPWQVGPVPASAADAAGRRASSLGARRRATKLSSAAAQAAAPPATAQADPMLFLENGEVRQAVYVQDSPTDPAATGAAVCETYGGRVLEPGPATNPTYSVLQPEALPAGGLPQSQDGAVCIFNCGPDGCASHAEQRRGHETSDQPPAAAEAP